MMPYQDESSVAITAENFKAAMASFAAGVTIITTLDADNEPQAVTATSFSSLSLTPPLCLVCIDRRARTHRPLLLNGCFAVNILREDQQWLSARFASAVDDRFNEVAWTPGEATGCPIIEGALVTMECRIVEVYSGGDHDIFIGRPASVGICDGAPLVYWRGRYSTLPPPPTTAERAGSIGHMEGTEP